MPRSMRASACSRPRMASVSNSGGATVLPLTATRTMPSSGPTLSAQRRRPGRAARRRWSRPQSRAARPALSRACCSAASDSRGRHLFADEQVGVVLDLVWKKKSIQLDHVGQGLEPLLDQGHQGPHVGGVDVEARPRPGRAPAAGPGRRRRAGGYSSRSSTPAARRKSGPASC